MATASGLISSPTEQAREDQGSVTQTHAIVRVLSPDLIDDKHGSTTEAKESQTSQTEAQESAISDTEVATKRPRLQGSVSSDRMDLDQEENDEDVGEQEADGAEDDASAKKKTGQRFFCTGYPPCNLSFTRSEHLARHIRKHTGERPFQCHCSRRFSRLDNLRQHAQTVHVNEEIPNDSLAATGTRYQRQIRTDRVRPPPRPRTSTMSSTGSHSRGHSRNLSTSSVGSTVSNYSVATSTDTRRRPPPPLLMASDGSNRPSTPPVQYSGFTGNSPGDLSTPASATYSVTPGSPNFSSTLGSPVSTTSHAAGILGSSRVPARRLSVPSSAHLYQQQYSGISSPANQHYGGPVIAPGQSTVMSPTSATFAPGQGYSVAAGDDWRRRTWHPSTYLNYNVNYNRPPTSGLTYSQTPDAPQPAYAQNANAVTAAGVPRLPGIESFDQVAGTPTLRRNQSGVSPHTGLLAAPDIEGHRRNVVSWDGSRHSQHLETKNAGGPSTSWGQQTIEQMQSVSQARPSQVMGPPPLYPNPNLRQPQQIAKEALSNLQTSSNGARPSAYQGDGPGPAVRTSPEDSSSSDGVHTPKTSVAEMHPAIVNSGDFIESQLLAGDTPHNPCLAPAVQPVHLAYFQSQHADTHAITHHESNSRELNRLEALVEVAIGNSSP